MEAKRDYYDVLGIDRQADEKAIKRAYRRLAKRYHPDMNAGDAGAEKKFQEITEAYAVLGDAEKKKLYDQFGHAAFEQTGTENGSGTRNYYYEGAPDDLFEDLFGDIFKERRKKQGSRTRWSAGGEFHMKGADLKADVTVSFEEAAFGCDKVVDLTSPESGRSQRLQIHIPAGIDTGQSVRLKGKGMAGYAGGEPGDLLLRVHVQEKPGYKRKGMDVYTTVFIPYATAVLGGETRVHTLHGDVLCRIREGTQSGSKIRLKGKGIVSMKNPAVCGDQYVTVQIEVPKNLSPRARQKLMEYQNAG